jgi:hypothetical protein
MDVFDVVMRLNGPIEPVGDSSVDRTRLENLRALCDLTELLFDRIEAVAEATDDHLASVKVAKECAAKFLASARNVQAIPLLPDEGWVDAGLVCQACTGDAPRGKCLNRRCVGGPIVRELVPPGAAARGNTPYDEGPFTIAAPQRCAADRDGDCTHGGCPQLRDGEPARTGRSCPHVTGSSGALDDAAQLARVKACPVCKGDGSTSTDAPGIGGGHIVRTAKRCTACGGKPVGPRPPIVQAAVDFMCPPTAGVGAVGHQGKPPAHPDGEQSS